MREPVTPCSVVALGLLAGLAWALLGGSAPCFNEPDPTVAEFCGGSVSQTCGSHSYRGALQRCPPLTREVVMLSCRPIDLEVACGNEITRCWTLWECRWIASCPPGFGLCVNKKTLDHADASVKVLTSCGPPT